jgi:uncharacterized protein (DUF1501 family)
MLNRRHFIASGLSGVALSAAFPVSAGAAASNPKRLLVIIQRGAADGLSTVMPTGDPVFAAIRPAESAVAGAKLNSLFSLHPKMTETASMFGAKEARFIHALASGYRDRSHFDGQNMLESGAARPYGRDDGWLNRLAASLPSGEAKALAIAPSIPLLLRGRASVDSYAPSRLPEANEDLMRRVSMLYAEDATLAPMWESALSTRDMAGSTMGGGINKGAEVGKMVAGLMAGAAGARIVSLETDGWDTHTGQTQRLGNQLQQLDALIAAVKTGLGTEWKNTLVIVATEFGRTVALNGTNGTDHGTASAAMLFGGSLAGGGTVTADWPGLSPANLYEGRDLKPTLRMEQVVSDALAAHYGQDPAKLRRTLFPDFA